jgi:hypothetical protein
MATILRNKEVSKSRNSDPILNFKTKINHNLTIIHSNMKNNLVTTIGITFKFGPLIQLLIKIVRTLYNRESVF